MNLKVKIMRVDSDEKYVLDLVGEMLTEEFIWQKRFEHCVGIRGKELGLSFRLMPISL